MAFGSLSSGVGIATSKPPKIRARNIRKLLELLIIPALLISCAEKEPSLGSRIAGYRAPINKILFSPVAFDGAMVAVEGIVKNVERRSAGDSEKGFTRFKITDLSGNYINVSFPHSLSIAENDYVMVGGVYRRAENEIEGNQIEKFVSEEELDEFLEKRRKELD